MHKILSFIGKLFFRFSIYFTVSIGVFFISLQLHQYISFLGILFIHVNQSIMPFILGIIAIGAFLIAFCVELVCSGYFFSNLKYVWRIVILCSLNTILFAVIALVFNWFPADNLYAWGSFFLYVTIINISWGGAIIIKTKLQDRKDNKLLENYKKQ